MVAYAVQVAVALYFELAPVAEARLGDERYVIRRGYTLPGSLTPIVGALALHSEIAVTLSIYDREGRKKTERGFDMAVDIYEAYPAVWPEHNKRANKAPEPTPGTVTPRAIEPNSK